MIEPTNKRSIQGKIEATKTRFKPVQTGTNQYNLESIIEILPIQDRELVEKYLPVAKDIFHHLELNEQISNKMRDTIIRKFQDTEYELSRSRTLQIQKILKNGKEILIVDSLKIA
jgi:tryptophanyl-tRNA synthetase